MSTEFHSACKHMFYLSGLAQLHVLLNSNLPVALESQRHFGKYSHLDVLDIIDQILLGFVNNIASTMNYICDFIILKKLIFYVAPQASWQ